VGKQPPLSEDVWELYDTTKDWSQAHNLATEMPDKLAELKRLFDLEASKYNVFPLDDRKAERTNPDLAGRLRRPGPLQRDRGLDTSARQASGADGIQLRRRRPR
jgi:hypothetical protein